MMVFSMTILSLQLPGFDKALSVRLSDKIKTMETLKLSDVPEAVWRSMSECKIKETEKNCFKISLAFTEEQISKKWVLKNNFYKIILPPKTQCLICHRTKENYNVAWSIPEQNQDIVFFKFEYLMILISVILLIAGFIFHLKIRSYTFYLFLQKDEKQKLEANIISNTCGINLYWMHGHGVISVIKRYLTDKYKVVDGIHRPGKLVILQTGSSLRDWLPDILEGRSILARIPEESILIERSADPQFSFENWTVKRANWKGKREFLLVRKIT